MLQFYSELLFSDVIKCCATWCFQVCVAGEANLLACHTMWCTSALKCHGVFISVPSSQTGMLSIKHFVSWNKETLINDMVGLPQYSQLHVQVILYTSCHILSVNTECQTYYQRKRIRYSKNKLTVHQHFMSTAILK